MLIRDFVMQRQIARRMPAPDASIMDLGCADLGLLMHLRRRFPNAQLFGADITDRSFRAQARDAGIQNRTFDISKETWPDRQCDIITAVDMLEHVEDVSFSMCLFPPATGQHMTRAWAISVGTLRKP